MEVIAEDEVWGRGQFERSSRGTRSDATRSPSCWSSVVKLIAKMYEFDRIHVPEIVSRFEEPITESQVDESALRRGSSTPVEETELGQASLLPKANACKKVR